MDCLRITGDFDYISFTCCSNTQALNTLIDELTGRDELGIKVVKTRIILEPAKWYFGLSVGETKVAGGLRTNFPFSWVSISILHGNYNNA